MLTPDGLRDVIGVDAEDIYEVGTKLPLLFPHAKHCANWSIAIDCDSENGPWAGCVCTFMKQSLTPLPASNSTSPLPSSARTQARQHLKLIKHKSPQRHRCNLKPLLTFRGSFINLLWFTPSPLVNIHYISHRTLLQNENICHSAVDKIFKLCRRAKQM